MILEESLVGSPLVQIVWQRLQSMEHIGPQVTQDTTRIVVSEQPLLYRVYVRSVGVYSGIMCGCVRYVLRVARVDSGWGVQILFVAS